MGLCCYTCATPLESLHVFTSLKSATISASILSRKGTTLVNLAKILPPTLKYLKIEVPFSRSYHDHQGRSGKGHQDELLAFLPDIGKEFEPVAIKLWALIKSNHNVGQIHVSSQVGDIHYTLDPAEFCNV